MENFIAHVKEENGEWHEHLLEEHLLEVSKLAKTFLGTENEGWLDIAGRWHDLGKYQKNWQLYLKSKSGYQPNAHIESQNRPNHSTAGAIHAINEFGQGMGHILAYIIAGHHAGLADWNTSGSGKGTLKYRLETSKEEYFNSIKKPLNKQISQYSPSQTTRFRQRYKMLTALDENAFFESGRCRFFRYRILF